MSSSNNRRPAPRRSNLAGSSPVTPPPGRESAMTAAADESAERQRDDVEPRQPERIIVERQKTKATAPTKYPPKVSFYQDREDTNRVRGAILHTMAIEGARSLSQFISQAVMAEVERLEKKYNGGKPFPPVGARELPQGRPMGE